MARIIKCDDTYLAYVNRAGYKRDIRKYERKLRLWNIFHKLFLRGPARILGYLYPR